jgi:predicted amidophosphoribosyltransferase
MKIPTEILQTARAIATALFPPRCGACATPMAVHPTFALCDDCLQMLTSNDGTRCAVCDAPGPATLCGKCSLDPPAFTRVIAPYLYGGPLADAITAMKFRPREELAKGLAKLIYNSSIAVREALHEAEAIVAVPLSAKRRRERGFNQSAVIAREFGRQAARTVLYPPAPCPPHRTAERT